MLATSRRAEHCAGLRRRPRLARSEKWQGIFFILGFLHCRYTVCTMYDGL